MRTGAGEVSVRLSRPVGCALAAAAVFISQLCVHLWVYGRDPESFHPLRFFAAPATVSIAACVLAVAWAVVTVLRGDRSAGRVRGPLDTRTTLLYGVLAAVVISATATLMSVEFDPQFYWTLVALLVGVPALGFAVGIVAILVLIAVPLSGSGGGGRSSIAPDDPEALELRERLGR